MKRSCGFSGLSASAASGQAPTQLRHSVQRPVSTCRLPKGRPAAGRAISSGRCGACASRWSIARSSVARLSACAAKRPAAARPAPARPQRASSGQVARIAGLDQQAQVLAVVAQARQDGLRRRHLLCQRLAVFGGFFVGEQHPHLARALGDGGQPQVHADAGRVPHRHRQHARRQALQAAVACAQAGARPSSSDQPRAGAFAVQQQRGVAAAGMP
jgi:hypothetical protein